MAVADRNVHRRGSQVHHLVAGLQLQIDARMPAAEIGHARHQPLHGEGIGRRDGHLHARARMRQARQRRLEGIEPVAQHRIKLHARLGQRHPAHVALEQRQPGLRLQRADLVADRGWRHRQLLGGGLETAQARGRLEYAQPGQRKGSALHDLPYR